MEHMNDMNPKEQTEFDRLRRKVADAIAEYLKADYGHKSYEGTWELLIAYPDYFQDSTGTAAPEMYQLTLHCYVLGPGRHYD